jgi:hypothetical protein
MKEGGEGIEDLVQRLEERARARQELAAEAERHIAVDGDWPVAALGIRLGYPLSEAWVMLPTLPLVYPHEPLDAEIVVARESAGGPVVLDTSTLHSLQLLGEPIVEAVLAEFPLSLVGASVVDDLLSATAFRLADDAEPVRQLAWDQEAQRLVAHEFSPEQAAVPRERLRAMHRIATRLHIPPDTAAIDVDADAQLDQPLRTYRETAELAQSRQLAVYSDDRFIRKLFALGGIRSFGTLALLHALEELSVLRAEEVKEAVARLCERGIEGPDGSSNHG